MSLPASLARPKRDNSETLARIAGSLAQEKDVEVPKAAAQDKEFEAPAALEAPVRDRQAAPKVAKVAAPGSSLEEQARMAWASIAQPVTEESFVAWYCATQKKSVAAKRPTETPCTGPVSKKQSVLPGAAMPQTLSQAKRTALLKGVVTSLKAAIKSKGKWHAGDSETLSGSTVCDVAEFGALFPGVALTSSGGVLTTFKLSRDDLDRAFGSTLKATVGTYNRPRSFAKSYKTGSADLDFSAVRAQHIGMDHAPQSRSASPIVRTHSRSRPRTHQSTHGRTHPPTRTVHPHISTHTSPTPPTHPHTNAPTHQRTNAPTHQRAHNPSRAGRRQV